VNSYQKGGQQRIYLLGIAVSVLVVYVSSLYADYLPIDDGGILQAVRSGTISISKLFLGGGKEYYRPLATLSLLGDFYLFGGKTAGYHLGNILLHLFNALLVYRLATIIFKAEQAAYFYSFLAALLFAVHPINSEAVVWISCRPDLLCCFFSLLCLVTVLRIEKSSGPAVFVCLFLFFLCSLLSKEASLLLPLVIASYFILERKNIGVRKAVNTLAALMLAVFVYLLLRKGFPLVSVPVRTDSLVYGEMPSLGAIDAIAAFGFYIRKLFYPFPLNFTIIEINSRLYAVVALVFIAAAVLLGKKEANLRFPIVFLAVALIPPIGAMLIFPLWTPYAERYLYLPSVAFALCVVLFVLRFGKRIPRILLVACIFAIALPTAFRVWLWTKPLLFWQDAVAKAPNFGTARLVLASEYLKAGQYGKADENLRLAVRLGLHGKTRESSVEIRKQLDEKMRGAVGIPFTAGKPAPTPAASPVR
jgi:hypothetical protein